MPNRNVDLIATAAATLGATEFLATWGGEWARRPTIAAAIAALPSHRSGKQVIVVPCSESGFLDDQGRIYPELASRPKGCGEPLVAFIGTQRALIRGGWTIVDAVPWS